MKSFIMKYLYLILAGFSYLFIHEGVHLIQAFIHGIFEGLRVLPLGVEVVVQQPMPLSGLALAAFSGLSSIVTLSLGYLCLYLIPFIKKGRNQVFKNFMYYFTLVFLLLDALYISVLSFFVGGDINGISIGLSLPFTPIRLFFFLILVLNLRLVTKKLFPAYTLQK